MKYLTFIWPWPWYLTWSDLVICTPYVCTLHLTTTMFASTLYPSDHTLLPHPQKNHTLCRHPSSIWPHHFTPSTQEPHPLTILFIPITPSPDYTLNCKPVKLLLNLIVFTHTLPCPTYQTATCIHERQHTSDGYTFLHYCAYCLTQGKHHVHPIINCHKAKGTGKLKDGGK